MSAEVYTFHRLGSPVLLLPLPQSTQFYPIRRSIARLWASASGKSDRGTAVPRQPLPAPCASTARSAHLRLVTTELSMAVRKPLETDGELDVTATDDVLYLELCKLRVEAKLLHDSGVFARRKPRVILALRARHDHLPRRKNKRGGLGITNAHDDSRETL